MIEKGGCKIVSKTVSAYVIKHNILFTKSKEDVVFYITRESLFSRVAAIVILLLAIVILRLVLFELHLAKFVH
ncbi:hypothetical protein JN11_01701 [Mucilaginibacter frigoritolerans]|jgi:hypothetical protein|uniref:Uncharacterized protein n=1 Tax=Mucilaginibacter frigoritolerans TaxID=652788 RepID=A0A562U6V0_9SPHI|nr:hypothetical protein JN11_01701 [Mucilaginibacter frigoritolerans]